MTAAVLSRSRLRLRDAAAVGLVGIRSRRVRAILTAAGVAIGIAAMVAVLGISTSSRADLLATLDRLGTNLLRVSPGQSFTGGDTVLPESAPGAIRRVGPVTAASATAGVDATVRRSEHIPSSETGGIAVTAAEPDLLDTLGGTLAAGTFLNDATATQPAVVLGAKAAERLGIDDLHATPLVWLGDQWFAVVGILHPLTLTPDLDAAAFVGFPVAEERLGSDGTAASVSVRTDVDAVEDVRAVLPRTASPQAPEEVEVTRPSDVLEARAAADTTLTALLLGLGAVALLVGGVGIANVMVVAVLERRTEIGVRRALGATRGHVRLQFVVESMLLAGAGGLLGVLIGALITAGYATTRGWPISLPVAGLVAAAACALAIGAVAGLYPAARAARLPPAEAVRPG